MCVASSAARSLEDACRASQTARTVRKAGEQGESAQEPGRACALQRGAHQLYGLQGRATECSKQSTDASLSRKR